ncbi:hypothetical protein EAE96_010820 [Botrytis aclada]|nr:hypothetical protein EAE96_010820 [Botrytis aclada]
MSEGPEPPQTPDEVNNFQQLIDILLTIISKQLDGHDEIDPIGIYESYHEEGIVCELNQKIVTLQARLSVAEFQLKIADAVKKVANGKFSISEKKREIEYKELLESRKGALVKDAALQEAKVEIEKLRRRECSHSEEISTLRSAKEEEERKTKELQEKVKKLQEEAIAREQAFREAKLDTETKHRKKLRQLTANLEATTTKAEQASTNLQNIKQGSKKALEKVNAKLAKKTAAFAEKERELSMAVEALATKSSEFENTSKALFEIQQSHSSCTNTIKSLELDLRDAKAINNSSRTSAHAEADRIKKGVAKATADLEARLSESEYNNDGLERKCRMFENRYSEQVIASAKLQEHIIRSVVEERRSHDRVLELQKDLEKQENICFELELAVEDLQHKFGDGRE